MMRIAQIILLSVINSQILVKLVKVILNAHKKIPIFLFAIQTMVIVLNAKIIVIVLPLIPYVMARLMNVRFALLMMSAF